MSTTTDPIADMLSRIRNAVAIGKSEVYLPHSAVKESVARLLKKNEFIGDVAVLNDGVIKSLRLTIKNNEPSQSITEIVRLSKPGRRQYVGVKEIPVIKRGRGIVILSTSKGIMTGEDAIKHQVGGELICKVY